MSLLPLWFLYIISDVFFVLIYYVVRYRRKLVKKNLCDSFPEKDRKEIRSIEKRYYHWLCDYVVETVKMTSMSHKQIKRRMQFKGLELVEESFANGRSCSLFMGHYCNWEWISTLPLSIKAHGICAELYHPIENPDYNRLFLYIRQRFGSICIPMQETLRHLVKYQKEDRPMIIGYIADQKPNWRNIHFWITFLNHNTPAFTGSERIIKHMHQVFFYGDVRRIKRGYYECDFRLIEPNSEIIPDFKLTELYMRELEATIRREPALWLWTHDRWSRTKEEFDIRFYEKDGKVFEKVTEAEYARLKGWRSYWHH
jgi:KDO2-lipid IV(A) lauroyltransferase